MAYNGGYYSKITIAAGLSVANLTNYTLWITAQNISANVLSNVKTNARSDLNDVRFSTDVAGDSLLSLYKILADPTNDDFVFFVGPVNVTGSTATEIYMHWGDSSLTTDSSSSNAFDSLTLAAYSPRSTGSLADMKGTNPDLSNVTALSINYSQVSTHASQIYRWEFTGSCHFSMDNAVLRGAAVDSGATLRALCAPDGILLDKYCLGIGNNITTVVNGRFLASRYLASARAYGVRYRWDGSASGTSGQTQELIASASISSAWTYWAAKYDRSAAALGGIVWDTTATALASGLIDPITATLSQIQLGSGGNPITGGMFRGFIGLAIYDETARADEWLGADNFLMMHQATYVTWDTNPTAHTTGYTPTFGPVAVIGSAPLIFAAKAETPTLGPVAIIGSAPTITTGGAAEATPSLGPVAVIGSAPFAGAAKDATPTLGPVAIIGSAALAGAAKDATPTLGPVAIIGSSPLAGAAKAADPTLGPVAIIGSAPTIFGASGAIATPVTGPVAIVGVAPTISAAKFTDPIAGPVAIVGSAPTISAVKVATPTLGPVAVIGNAPTAIGGGVSSATPTAGPVAVIGAAPTITKAVVMIPTTGPVSIPGDAPVIGVAVSVTPTTGNIAIIGGVPGSGVSSESIIRRYTKKVYDWEMIAREEEDILRLTSWLISSKGGK